MTVREAVDGVVIGLLIGFEDGRPLVVFPGNPRETARPARSLAHLSADDAGCEVALLFEDGALERPLIVGRIVEPVRPDAVPKETREIEHDGETVRITAKERIELRVGDSAIILEKDGHVTVRGRNLVSHASASNRIRGGSINLN
ncbi:DUF6484 domain-containing protein [Jannaschia seohaensis]|uniref:DUF6484 domain-containing protein n=1 Tax=Jannaschia seohaensis TaxID=475081 RepID=A0A2Y9AXH7_9RHOB|nr:DUF6484 domain-containing protein [Jannaschia seohaensis]PWJ16569.1 hypothetical protein BCF38_10883 [Jannaschia seohaensis]SSA48806.1 hypothetical protein SAMN05421539_10883 [Jannaschia seohaensis]